MDARGCDEVFGRLIADDDTVDSSGYGDDLGSALGYREFYARSVPCFFADHLWWFFGVALRRLGVHW